MASEAQSFSVTEENKKVEPKSLLDVEVDNESTALKLILIYLKNAQKSGLFDFQESGKIWEALQEFGKDQKEVGTISKTIQEGTRLLDIKVNNIQDALYVLIGFLNVLQKKGVFTFEESSKILSCINVFKN